MLAIIDQLILLTALMRQVPKIPLYSQMVCIPVLITIPVNGGFQF